MKTIPCLITVGGICAVLTAMAGNTQSSGTSSDARIEHGKYLVHHAGMCVDCHTPRDEKGGLIESKLLSGAPIGFKPTVPMPWMPVAPALAGLPAGYGSEELVRFLMTGARPNGTTTLPPMPPYRFNREDAEAITAYLRSLPSGSR